MKRVDAWTAAAGILVSLSFLTGAPVLAATPFGAMSGTWNGSGTARLQGGKSENMRCKGYFNPGTGGSSMSLSIRCANAAAKVELRANLTSTGTTVAGDWEERTYNQAGTVSGTATATTLKLSITGGITGTLNLSVDGSTQSLALLTQGSPLVGMTVSLSK